MGGSVCREQEVWSAGMETYASLWTEQVDEYDGNDIAADYPEPEVPVDWRGTKSARSHAGYTV